MIFGSAKKYIYKFTNRKEKERRKRVKGGREEGREERKELSGVENCEREVTDRRPLTL